MEQITAQQFSEAEGVEDWRVLWWRAFAVFRTRDFATGLALVNEIGRLAEAADHHPDIEMRYGRIEVRLATHSTMSLTDKDLSLAREISAAARELGVEAEPTAIRTWEFALDALNVDAVRDFWCAVLGYEKVGDSDIADPLGLYPPVFVQQMDEPRSGRDQIHIDVAVPHDVAVTRVAEALAAGGTLLSDDHAPAWWTLSDPEGNVVDVATWQGRD
ncbi:VOC family protein [Nocardioides sp. YIM 152588]|uniref:VOC family protein n=1 Tax=Nocardioides sp. YIM 152588 TaxID=3158259 RepID=UPI0032E3F32E